MQGHLPRGFNQIIYYCQNSRHELERTFITSEFEFSQCLWTEFARVVYEMMRKFCAIDRLAWAWNSYALRFRPIYRQ